MPVDTLVQIINFVEMIAKEKKVKKKNVEELIETLADWLVELQDEYNLRK